MVVSKTTLRPFLRVTQYQFSFPTILPNGTGCDVPPTLEQWLSGDDEGVGNGTG